MSSRRIWRRVAALIASLSIIAASVVVALVLFRHARTGEWSLPTIDDVRAVKSGAKQVARTVKEKVKGEGPQPSKTIYLVGDGATLHAGHDDAPAGFSSIVRSSSKNKVTVPKWSGGKRKWKQLVACVEKQFAPFDVTITTERPATDDFMMAVIGGRAKDIGITTGHLGGLAPFNGLVIPKAVVFVFSRSLRNRVQTICEALAMEIAHAYGLDHAYYCPDVMTYLRGCGKKRFRDKDVPCGEKKKRVCKGGKPTQNSVTRLLEVLGPRPN